MADTRYGRIFKGHTLPYGILAGASDELRKAYYTHGYLHDKDMPDLPVPPVDVLEPCSCPMEELFKKELRNILHELVDGLTPRESKVLKLRNGLGDGIERTLEETGQVFEVTKERIRQIENKAIRKLRHPNRQLLLFAFPEIWHKTMSEPRNALTVKKQWEAARAQAWKEYQEEKKYA